MQGNDYPREMWKILQNAHKSQCAAAEHTLCSRLMSLKMGTNDSVRKFANVICEIEHELSYGGKKISPGNKKFVIFNGLRSEFSVNRTTLQEK